MSDVYVRLNKYFKCFKVYWSDGNGVHRKAASGAGSSETILGKGESTLFIISIIKISILCYNLLVVKLSF